MRGVRVDREEGARDRGQRRGQTVHVVEQIDAFVIPTSHATPSTVAAIGCG